MPLSDLHDDDPIDGPLYVRIPIHLQDYLTEIKDATGVTKAETVTLVLEIASKYLKAETIQELYNEYLILGREGIHLSQVVKEIILKNAGENDGNERTER